MLFQAQYIHCYDEYMLATQKNKGEWQCLKLKSSSPVAKEDM